MIAPQPSGLVRPGLLNVKLLFVLLVVAAGGIWWFYIRDGSSGDPVREVQNLIKPAEKADSSGGDPIQGPVLPPAPGPAAPVLPGPGVGPGPVAPPLQPPAGPIPPAKVAPPAMPPTLTPSPQDSTLLGRWRAEWKSGGHDHAVEWNLQSGGFATANRLQNNNQVSRFQFSWTLRGDTFLTELSNRSKSQYRYRSIDRDAFELTSLGGASAGAVLNFKRLE